MPELVSYPDSSVAFICGPQVKVGAHPSFDSIAIAQGKTLATSVPTPTQSPDVYRKAIYYDLAKCQYLNYFRTTDPAFKAIADRAADDFWASPWIGHGTVVGGPNNLSPREMAFAGLMLRAIMGRTDLWDYLERQTRAASTAWNVNKIGATKLPYDMREHGYAQLYAVLMAKVLPDSYPKFPNGTQQPSTDMVTDGAARRASFLANAENVAVNFFGELQRTDGSWRNDVPSENEVNIEQPFMTGLYLEAASRLYDLTANADVKINLHTQITRSCDNLWTVGYENSIVQWQSVAPPDLRAAGAPQYKWRSMRYYIRDVQLARGPSCGLTACGDKSVAAERLQNSTVIHAYGKAFQITGDEKYRTQAKELLGACFGDSVDTVKSLAGVAGGKEYCMFYRAAGEALAYIAGETLPPPPPPPPVEEPPPIPVPTPPTPCTISGPDSISVRRNSEGSINITLNSLSAPVSVNVEGSSGQVNVTPLSRIVSPTAGIAAFRVKVKNQSRTVTFNSPCGSKSVRVNVT